jgi:hypothetical protein
MQRAQQTTWIVAVLAAVAGTSLAGPKPVAKESKTPASVVDASESGALPAQCVQFLHIARDTRSEIYPWLQRLSVAACRQEISLPKVTQPSQLAPMVESLRTAMAPSIATYKDALARGPNDQIKILAAYGLGRTYTDMIVRARTRIAAYDQIPGEFGGVGYGAGSYLNRSLALHLALEPMMQPEHDGAMAAFAEVARLAEADPIAARTNAVMPVVIASARLESQTLR